MTMDSAKTSETLAQLATAIGKKRDGLRERSKTSQLWLNYQEMVNLSKSLIKADRTGNWQMHLQTVSECLPIFVAAGHFNYLKSAYYYVQEMSQLEARHPDLFERFQRGHYVIRRSNKFWAGLSADLVIEQCLMRALKTSGGLTRGSGMSEKQRTLWVLSTPVTSEYNHAMQEFNDLSFTTSEQHKETSQSRIERDSRDLKKILSKLDTCSPFSEDPSLRNIVNGVVADSEVDVHEFHSVGEGIISKMIGQPVFSVAFKRKDKAKTLGSSSSVKVAPDRTIDPGLLFQRFLVVSKTADMSLEDVMRYELSPFPSALFEAKKVFRKPDKPQLAHAILEHAETGSKDQDTSEEGNTAPKTQHYVLDGGSLLQRVAWKRGDTYGTIAQTYVELTVNRFLSATVVFDGYLSGPAIKDNTHQRRGKNNYPAVSFTEATEFVGKKDEFLSRDSNKQKMIDLISQKLRDRGCEVINSQGDADVDIVTAAVRSSETHSTTVIGEDTELLVLLLHHGKQSNKDLFFRSDKANANAVYHINKLQEVLGEELCTQLLFVHAYTGCDTTSRIFGIGKKTVLQKMKGDTNLKACANAFVTPNQATDAIEVEGAKAMTIIFGGKPTDSLGSLRYSTFSKKVVSSTSFVTPERLPPTESSTKFHSLRAYYQIMVWMEREMGIDPCEWGWKREGNIYEPVESDKNPAPDYLLKLVHCNCTTACGTSRCTCRRYGLPCTPACGQCQLEVCDNPYGRTVVEDGGDDSLWEVPIRDVLWRTSGCGVVHCGRHSQFLGGSAIWL